MPNQYSKVSDYEYLMSNVDWSGVAAGCSCWNWTGCVGQGGYPQTSKARDCGQRGNILTYITFVGTIPPGMFVCHSCDNRKCVNPRHLWLGTTQDNTKDKVLKGRQSYKPKLLASQQIQEIQKTYNGKRKEFAQKYGVSEAYITKIIIAGRVAL